ncbi:clavesin-1 isoform X3 [Agrilus planipennis]|uniref:Clavesin-1 isoform X1 n=1 Tax=Agrilus planipennis TaxID=224129 RepID=A0A1W4XA27_AGRPL|nr:clavesin-1 isoform X1 [Agrilus planipennis]XP_025831181.1 clavesin-1 isoform X2 [Agrilus planipennis]XP_025831182.1 clavesin-1 isoform X3 [Agrilus planipennis]
MTKGNPFELELGPLSPEAKELALKELRETPEIVQKAIEELRELLKNDDTIYFRDDDEFLLIFLRPCKFYAKSAYELMKRIADFKENNKALLDNLLPEDEKDAFVNHNVVNVLKDRDHKGRRVLIVNCGGTWNTSKVTADQLFRLFYLIHEAAILEPETQVRGVVVIMDFEGLSYKQVAALSITFSMRLLSFIQQAMPLRLKEVHMVKQPFIFKAVWSMFKPFIKEKLKSRMYFHGDKMPSLHQHLAPSHLPKNYGGELPEIDYTGNDWYPAIEEHVEHIKKLNTYGRVKKEK